MSYDSGWDFGPGNANDEGVNYGWEGGSSSSDSGAFWSGLGSAAGGLLNTAVNTWSQKELMQTAQNGQLRYIEGQRGFYPAQFGGIGGINPLWLMLGAGLVFVLAIKK